MLFFYFYNGQLGHRLDFGFLFQFAQRFLLRHSANNFEQRLLVKALVEVLHEATRVKLVVSTAHAQELVAGKQIHEGTHQPVDKTLNMRVVPLAVSPYWVTRPFPPSLQKHKLRRRHLHSTNLDIMQAGKTRHTAVVSQGMASRHPDVYNLEQIAVVQTDSSAPSTHSLQACPRHLMVIHSRLIRRGL